MARKGSQALLPGQSPFAHRGHRGGSILLFSGRNFVRSAFGFALRGFLVLLSLFLVAARTRRPVSLLAVSVVIWPECHEILTCSGLMVRLTSLYRRLFGILLVFAVCPARAPLETTLNSAARLGLRQNSGPAIARLLHRAAMSRGPRCGRVGYLAMTGGWEWQEN